MKLLLVASIVSLTFAFQSEARSQWVKTNCPTTYRVACLAVTGTNLFAGTVGYFNGKGSDGVFRTTDNGTSWTSVDSGLTDKNNMFSVLSLAASGTNVIAGTYRAGVYLTTNNGASWSLTGSLGRSPEANALAVSGANVFAATDSGVFHTSNNGTSWMVSTVGMPRTTYVQSLYADDSNLFAGTKDSGIYLSKDNGASWSRTGYPLRSEYIYAIAVSGSHTFAGGQGVSVSTDNGTNWSVVTTGLTNPFVTSLCVSGTNLFAGTFGGGVFLSSNNGTKWTPVNAGLTNDTIFSLIVSGSNLFAATSSSGVWRRPLSEFGLSAVPVSAQASISAISYPNPFTESIKIRFSTDYHTAVDVRIVNLFGTEVARIFTGEVESGEHLFAWDAIGMPPATYVCVIRSNERINAIPIILDR